ncbi:Glutamate receptor 2.2 [Thalictrum thalictroides]|uniref:Glutamate receptor 2.2 n=1 Tax=Thalictrum thalictroides TaxID=46969 RepID=A0A7J6V2P1_THATH|nr:Glutamate receptor 2.2 [Thalictrum thalictroides]
MNPVILLWLTYYLSLASKALGDEKENSTKVKFSIGAIVDNSSRTGKEETTAMKMAIHDYFNYTDNKPVLHIQDTGKDLTETTVAGKNYFILKIGHGIFLYNKREYLILTCTMTTLTAAMDLINKKQVRVVLGLRKWYEVALAAELSDRAKVPVLSFADAFPRWAIKRWPFLVQATHQQYYKQMSAVAAIVGTWRWRMVNFIYEDTDSATLSILPHLIDTLNQVGTSIENLVPLPPLASSLYDDLEKLKRKQCRVFIVHTSLSLAKQLFLEAKKMGLMEKDTVWITTTSISDHFHFLNSSVLLTMDGVLGVKTYYPQTGTQFQDFNSRFRSRFRLEHPEEVSLIPGIFALQAYDATRAALLAMGGRKEVNTTSDSKDKKENSSTLHGKELLQKILQNDFNGLTGEYHFTDDVLAASNTFRIVNVVGKSYRGMGFWSEGLGFSKTILDEKSIFNMSMEILGQVLWPGTPRDVPRGWALPTTENPLIIGVPENPTFNQFVNIRHVGGKQTFSGYSIEVFKAVVSSLKYHLPYEFVPYNGTYDSLVQQIYYKVRN